MINPALRAAVRQGPVTCSTTPISRPSVSIPTPALLNCITTKRDTPAPPLQPRLHGTAQALHLSASPPALRRSIPLLSRGPPPATPPSAPSTARRRRSTVTPPPRTLPQPTPPPAPLPPIVGERFPWYTAVPSRTPSMRLGAGPGCRGCEGGYLAGKLRERRRCTGSAFPDPPHGLRTVDCTRAHHADEQIPVTLGRGTSGCGDEGMPVGRTDKNTGNVFMNRQRGAPAPPKVDKQDRVKDNLQGWQFSFFPSKIFLRSCGGGKETR
eukprot:Hpha_TRINITY_DN16676_c3_g3::TRINITY_DN16676_c3_g3_i1::g.182886::m.182886